MKIEALTAKKKRVYGSDEDEDERDRLEREQREKVAAERAAREAEEAEARREAEESGRGLTGDDDDFGGEDRDEYSPRDDRARVGPPLDDDEEEGA